MSMRKIHKKQKPVDNRPANPSVKRSERPREPLSPKRGGQNAYFLYGRHPVCAALANPARKIRRLLVTKNALEQLPKMPAGMRADIVTAQELEALLPQDAVHQGYALEVLPLGDGNLDDVIAAARPILLLDQVTDPHNVGAILRSAAAFDAAGIIVTKHHAPEEGGVLAKSASGALETVPVVRVPNLVQAMEYLKKHGYWCAGMDGQAKQTLAEAKLSAKTALVMGAEGSGLRRLTAEHCDLLVKLPISGKMESLNVSNAAAIALYELSR